MREMKEMKARTPALQSRRRALYQIYTQALPSTRGVTALCGRYRVPVRRVVRGSTCQSMPVVIPGAGRRSAVLYLPHHSPTRDRDETSNVDLDAQTAQRLTTGACECTEKQDALKLRNAIELSRR
jgi:hypothetical protein